MGKLDRKRLSRGDCQAVLITQSHYALPLFALQAAALEARVRQAGMAEHVAGLQQMLEQRGIEVQTAMAGLAASAEQAHELQAEAQRVGFQAWE